ncbi:MAG: DNA/RNA non-specific endonuclease, partial [Gammaproteobacteria bacterium]
VAVSPDGPSRALDDYMWCPLLKEPGKIVAGEPINIIQHPKGERKQVVIRENRLLDALEGAELFYHYEADTEPGSSGSPVFNDQWKVVALHHSGVPKRNNKGELLGTDGKVWRKGDDPSRLDWVANEGVRVSKLVEFIAKASVAGAAKPLLKEFLDAKPPGVETKMSGPIRPPPVRPKPNNEEDRPVSDHTKASGSRSVTLTVPLHITFTLGVPGAGSTDAIAAPARPATEPDEGLEKVEIDPDYTNRLGYDPDFLGFKVPFPRLTNTSRRKAFALPEVSGDARFQLKYNRYSVIFNKERRLAFVAGVNFDLPVFRATDQKYRGVQIPREFWKVVVVTNDASGRAAAAFVVTQADLIEDLKEQFEVGEYKAVQVRVKDLETRT